MSSIFCHTQRVLFKYVGKFSYIWTTPLITFSQTHGKSQLMHLSPSCLIKYGHKSVFHYYPSLITLVCILQTVDFICEM